MDAPTRMRALLRYANFTHVADGLSDQGYSVSHATVSRWAKGKGVEPRHVRLVEELLGTAEEPPPEWARALQDDVTAIQETIDRMGELLAAMTVQGSSPSPPPADDPEDDRGADRREQRPGQ